MKILFLKPLRLYTYFYLSFFLASLACLSSCNSLFYQPSRRLFYEPRLVGYQEKLISFQGYQGNKLYGWFFHAQQKKAKATLVVYHGNAQNISAFFPLFAWITKQDYNLFLFDYSGYGGSHGSPSKEALHADSIAAYMWAKKETSTPLVLVGQSLGAAVLTSILPDIKDKRPIKAVILDSSFITYTQAASDVLAARWWTWLLQPLAYLVISNTNSPKTLFEKISPIPLLLIHCKQDQVIPFERGKEIFSLAKKPKTFLQAEQCHHIGALHNPIYRKQVLKFLNSTLSVPN